jgi:hypothetical protein
MTKSEIRETSKAMTAMRIFEQTRDAAMLGIAARTMGALVRAARSSKSQQELMHVADAIGVSGHSDYIVGRWA